MKFATCCFDWVDGPRFAYASSKEEQLNGDTKEVQAIVSQFPNGDGSATLVETTTRERNGKTERVKRTRKWRTIKPVPIQPRPSVKRGCNDVDVGTAAKRPKQTAFGGIDSSYSRINEFGMEFDFRKMTRSQQDSYIAFVEARLDFMELQFYKEITRQEHHGPHSAWPVPSPYNLTGSSPGGVTQSVPSLGNVSGLNSEGWTEEIWGTESTNSLGLQDWVGGTGQGMDLNFDYNQLW